MSKKVLSILISFIMIFSMVASATPVYALSTEAPIEITIEPDKTEVLFEDTVNYTVYISAVKRLQSVSFTLDIPEGLTYIDGAEVEGLATLLGAVKAEYTKSTKTFVCYGGGSYNSDNKTALVKFSCTVNSQTVGDVFKIALADACFADDDYQDYSTIYNFDSSKVTVITQNVAVTGVTVDDTLSLKVGETKTPSFSVVPSYATNKEVSFSSNNTQVATVNESTGAVTGVKNGTAVITITSADGNFTDTCTVVVGCVHTNKSTIPEKASDCKTAGWDSYKKCNDCEQLFKTDGTTELSDIPYKPLSTEHKYSVVEWESDKNNHWHECVCGVKANMASHIDQDNNGKCDVCNADVVVVTTTTTTTTKKTTTTTTTKKPTTTTTKKGDDSTTTTTTKKADNTTTTTTKKGDSTTTTTTKKVDNATTTTTQKGDGTTTTTTQKGDSVTTTTTSKIDDPTTTTTNKVIKGDVNGDGKVSVADARKLVVAIAKGNTDGLLEAGDVNNDNKISVADARKIVVAIAKNDYNF